VSGVSDDSQTAAPADRGPGDDAWTRDNLSHLGHCIAALQARLTAGHATSDAKKERARKQATTASQAADAVAAGMAQRPALDEVQTRFGLSPFEREVLLLCAAWELDRATTLAAFGGVDKAPAAPSFGLAMSNLDDSHWSATTPRAPLRRWGLVEAIGDSPPIVGAPLRIVERTLHYLKGVPVLDPDLETGSAPVRHVRIETSGQRAALDRLVEGWSELFRHGPGTVQVVGRRDCVQVVIAELAAPFRHGARRIRVRDLPSDRKDLRRLGSGLGHDALLGIAMTLLWCEREDEPSARNALTWLAEQAAFPVIVGSCSPLDLGVDLVLRVEVMPTSNLERLESWQSHLGSRADPIATEVAQLAVQFDVPPSRIERICDATGDVEGPFLARRLWDDCVQLAMPDLDSLAQLVPVTADWDDLVLQSAVMERLRGIVTQVRHRAELELRWGLGAGPTGGNGVTVLFSGPSGTGKTMAAGVMARELRLPLLRIDLSAVVSKWIGETEKHLRRVFDAAESGGAVLLFDEADALFGKRTEVNTAHDRHANVETSYLLQRLEQYRGLAILTTNHDENMDHAFLRRLRGVIRFPPPGPALRKELWRKAIAPAVGDRKLDLDRLSDLALSGGNIRNVAREAAARAVEAGTPLSSELLLTVAKAEAEELRRRSG